MRRELKPVKQSLQNLRKRAGKIKMLLLDVDGVLTDGGIMYDGQGREIKAFHVRDGHGIKLAQKAGITVGIITGRRSEVVAIRARELGITEVHQGIHDKAIILDGILKRYNLTDDQIAYVGDDIVDNGIFERAGLAVAVADADQAVKPFVHMITKEKGGRGAVREVINFILQKRLSTSSS